MSDVVLLGCFCRPVVPLSRYSYSYSLSYSILIFVDHPLIGHLLSIAAKYVHYVPSNEIICSLRIRVTVGACRDRYY